MEDKSVFKMTTRELRTYIRELTPQVNERYKSYKEALTGGAMTEKPILEERRARLVQLGTGKETKNGVGLGLTYKRKSELIQQARALEEFITIDTYSPVAENEADEKTYNAYKSFVKTTGSPLSFEEYKDLTEVMGAVGSHVLNEFGVYNIIKIYEESDENKRADLVKTMNDVTINAKGQGKTKEDIVDDLRAALGL